MKKSLYFESFISGVGGGGGHCFTERDFLEVEIVISPLIFEILKEGFQFSTPLIVSMKKMLEFLIFNF